MRAPVDDSKKIRKFYIDPRSSVKKCFDSLAKIEVIISLYIMMLALSVISPVFSVILVAVYIVFAINLKVNSWQFRTLPLRLPLKSGNVVDRNTPKVAHRFQFEKAVGNIHIGNELFNRKELWEPAVMLLTHMLVVGSTGSGKTQTLISLNAASSLMLGGATIYLDAKAFIDVSFYFQNLARIFGREDSLRFMSFRTGNKSVEPGDWRRLSNTVGIFAMGSASVCIQLLEDMMPDGGQNQVFKDKALAVLKGFMPCAEELRDKKIINLTPYMISQLMTIPKLIEMAWPEHFEGKITYVDNHSGDEITIPNHISQRKRRALQHVLIKLGIKTDEKSLKDPSKQPSEVNKQFSYADGYIVKPLVDFGSTYGHIFECDMGEVDTRDIMLNNHILVIYVPAIESSKDQRQTQGRIGLSMIRLAIANGMGDKSEGHIDDILRNLPIDKQYISTITIDEYAEAAVTGFAVTSTQARGFGVSMIFSNQDIAGMLNASVEETKQIFGNTRIKYLMTMEDPNETIEWFVKLAGEMSVLVTSGLSKGSGMSYVDQLQGQIQNVSRIDFLDVKEQEASEAHIFEGDKLVRGKTFHHGLPDFKEEDFQFVRQLEVKSPTVDETNDMRNKYMAKRVIRNMVARNSYPPSKSSHLKKSGTESNWISELLAVPTFEPKQEDHAPYATNDVQQLANEDITPRQLTTSQPGNPIKPLNPGKVVQTKKNNWVYGFKTSPNMSTASALAKSISAVAKQTGVDEHYAAEQSTKQAEKISQTLKYTSKPIEPKSTDKDDLWMALEAFENEALNNN